DRAVAGLKEALRHNPDSPYYRTALRNQYRNLAETCLQLGDPESACAAALAMTEAAPPGDDAERDRHGYFAARFLARGLALARDGGRPGAAQQRAYHAEAVRLLDATRQAALRHKQAHQAGSPVSDEDLDALQRQLDKLRPDR